MSKGGNNDTEGQNKPKEDLWKKGGAGGEGKADQFVSFDFEGGEYQAVAMPAKIEGEIKSKLDDAIDKLNSTPEVINEIIGENRYYELRIATAAQEFHEDLLLDVNKDLKKRQHNMSNFKDNKKAIAILESDQKKIAQIQEYITTFRDNVQVGENYKRDKKTIKAEDNELLMQSEMSKNRQGRIKILSELGTQKVKVHSVEQLEARSKQIDVMHKTWKELSQMKNDTDRSFGYRKLSDNLASMAMTGINTGRQGMAFARALLEWAVLDVLYEGLKGAGKGLMKGAGTGYKGANKGIKAAANAMHVMMDRSEKNLEKAVDKTLESHKFVLNIKDLDEKNTREKADIILTNLQDLQKNNGGPESTTQYDADIKLLEKARRNASLYAPIIGAAPNPNRATKGAAALGGLAGGLVVSICNTIWEGIKNPALAVWDI